MSTAFIAFGGNLGDVLASFNAACSKLTHSCTILAKSKLYHTAAIGPLVNGKPQPDYLNAIIKVSTELNALDLLQELHRIEAEHGRERIEHWGARTLDLDLLAYDNLISEQPHLMLPHPYLHKRLFVLQPLADVQKEWLHPVLKQDVSTMLAKALTQEQNTLFQGTIWTNNAQL